MPRATGKLSRGSSPEEIDAAISATIAELRRSNHDQDAASAIAFEEARRKTGRRLKRPRRGRNRAPTDLATRERAGNAAMETLNDS